MSRRGSDGTPFDPRSTMSQAPAQAPIPSPVTRQFPHHATLGLPLTSIVAIALLAGCAANQPANSSSAPGAPGAPNTAQTARPKPDLELDYLVDNTGDARPLAMSGYGEITTLQPTGPGITPGTTHGNVVGQSRGPAPWWLSRNDDYRAATDPVWQARTRPQPLPEPEAQSWWQRRHVHDPRW